VKRMSGDLFAYGTLMSGDIMLAVTGHRFPAAPGVLRGFRRNRIRGEVYPGIIPSPEERVDGIVYSNLTEDDWKRLDLFEGEMYVRSAVTVQLGDGTVRQAQTYVLKPQFENRLTSEPWTLEEFLLSGKARFESQYQGFAAVSREKEKAGPDYEKE
jgi:gamma-glutamylcyclotransferase (GGCT)/AIG2-like uncharacterized protein YtfP